MKYENFEDLYRDNGVLIDFEFESRFFELLNRILEKIDWYQEKEHDKIDGGNSGMENDVYRKNIINLERIYKPLYNYIYDLPLDMYCDERFPMIMSMKHKFIDMALPTEEEINREYRGKPGWHTKLYQLNQKQRKMAELLEGLVVWAYELGSKKLDEEPKDVYSDQEHLATREARLRHLQTYAHDSSIARMVASIYDMGYREGLRENPGDYEKAAEFGLKDAEDFLNKIFTTDSDENIEDSWGDNVPEN